MKARIARPDDLPRLLTLRCALWPDVELRHHELMLNRRADSAARCATVVLENEEGEVCGFAEATREIALGSEAARVQLDAVFVTPPMRGKGGARQLLEAVQRWAHGRGASGLFCDVPLEDEQAWALLQRLGFTDGERRIRASLAINAAMEVDPPRAAEALPGADEVPGATLASSTDDDFELVQMEKVRSPVALVVNVLLFVCAIFSFANTNIYSKDMISGMLLPLLDVAFVLYFSLLFVAMRYRKRADSRARADQLFNEPPKN